MLKELFHISRERTDPGNEKLSLHLGTHHCSYAITNREGNELFELVYCTIPHLDEHNLSAFRSAYPRTAEPFPLVCLAVEGQENFLVPSWCLRAGEEKSLLKVLQGDCYARHAIAEPAPTWQVHNLYAIAYPVYDWLNQHYPRHLLKHPVLLGLKSIPALEEGCIMADFDTHAFSVLVTRGSRLLLAQRYTYISPSDVLYILLGICQQFQLVQEAARLLVSGLIERESALFFELNQYFLQLSFREAAWEEGADQYPRQYFTALNDLALCAS